MEAPNRPASRLSLVESGISVDSAGPVAVLM